MGAIARRPGPIVLVHAHAAGAREIRSERLLVEKSVCVNTTAAGGNASLMAVG
jgi:RHH-type proline utilization regulon transcriptional repressor/proline dehydrogenase/delta 1-pyrroline-5-carboxylate dehydrogenase